VSPSRGLIRVLTPRWWHLGDTKVMTLGRSGHRLSYTLSISRSIRALISAFGNRPRAAPRLSATYLTCAAPGIAHVTVGYPRKLETRRGLTWSPHRPGDPSDSRAREQQTGAKQHHRERYKRRLGVSRGIRRNRGEGERRRDRPAPRPRLSEHGVGDGEVVKERFVGPLTGVVTRRVHWRIGWRTEAGRDGGQAQVGEGGTLTLALKSEGLLGAQTAIAHSGCRGDGPPIEQESPPARAALSALLRVSASD
jgi:hypothetical protein